MIKVKWIIESFSIINYNNQEVEYEELSTNQNLIGSFDYMGDEGYDNFLVNKETKEIVYIGLGIPQEFSFKENFFTYNNISLLEYSFDDLFLTLKEKNIFNEARFSIFDMNTDRLICISSFEDNKYQVVKINNYFFLLFVDWQYKGFILNDAFKRINNYNVEKVDNRFNYYMVEMLKLVNKTVYDKMENEDKYILQKLKNLKKNFLIIDDNRASGAINFINNCIFAFY